MLMIFYTFSMLLIDEQQIIKKQYFVVDMTPFRFPDMLGLNITDFCYIHLPKVQG